MREPILGQVDLIPIPGTMPQRYLPACKKHMWMVGSKKPPTSGCKICWFAYYLDQVAKLPLAEQQAKLDELKAVTRGMANLEIDGKFDYKPLAKPIIEKGEA